MKKFRKYFDWYNSLKPSKQTAISFIFNWFYWLIAWLIAERFFFDEQRTWLYHIFHATWMAFFMTNILKWKQIKLLFKSKKSNEKSNSQENK